MDESLLAYLLGPAVMVLIGCLLWLAAHHHGKILRRPDRWLDTHYVDLMHHR